MSSSIDVVAMLGMLLGVYAPWVDARALGPVTLAPFVYGLFVIVLPNVITTSALALFFGALTRSMFGVYVGLLVFLVAWILSGSTLGNVDHRWVAALADPTASAALGETTRYWTAEEWNTRLPGLEASLVVNRLLWLVVAAGLVGATTVLFRARRAGTGRAWWPSRKPKATPSSRSSSPTRGSSR